MKKLYLLIFLVQLLILNAGYTLSQSVWSWQQPLPTGNLFYAVDFENAQTGYVAGTVGTIMKTTNGGINWNFQNSTFSGILTDLSVAGNGIVVAVGDSGVILRTSNAGASWTRLTAATNIVFRSVYFADQRVGFIKYKWRIELVSA